MRNHGAGVARGGCRKRFRRSKTARSRDFQRETGRKKMRKVIALGVVATVFALAAVFATPALAQEAKRMSIEELKGMLGNPDVLIVDVRRDGDWASSKFKIKGAVREDPEKVDTWMSKYPKDKTLVFYCA
jgi:predicted sulfurtransferase